MVLLCLPVLAMLDGNKAGLRCASCPDNLIQILDRIISRRDLRTEVAQIIDYCEH